MCHNNNNNNNNHQEGIQEKGNDELSRKMAERAAAWPISQ
jgi:hypothetical protein